MVADSVNPVTSMETNLIDYSEDPLEGIHIFGRQLSSEVYIPFSRELTKVIAPLLLLTCQTSAVIDLLELPIS